MVSTVKLVLCLLPVTLGNKSWLFVTKPLQVWTKQSSAFLSHEECKYHHDSMTRVAAFRGLCSAAPTQYVACMLSKQHKEQVDGNTMEVKPLLECVCFCAMQGLSLRGHRDDHTAAEC